MDTGFGKIDTLDDFAGISGDIVIPKSSTGVTLGDNEEFEEFGEDIFDFTDTDPFSEGRY